jgi:glyoxylate reductase
MTPAVAVTSPLPGRAEQLLAERCRVRVNGGAALTDQRQLAEFIADARAAVTLLANPVTDQVFGACPELEVVANVAVGHDNIDLDAAAARGIWVTNTPDVLTEATADLTWALILAVTRRVVEGDRLVRSGNWCGWQLDQLLGSGLEGRTLGIVGYGRIGRAVARRALGFGMQLAYTDRAPIEGAHPPARFLELDELLASSSVVSLHAPLTERTRHLLDERRLRLMPEGAFLVNTARGPLVDEQGLVRVLADGHLGGAGLDVYEHEPDVHPALVERADVVLAPHIGSATVETRAAMAELAARNVLAVLDGCEPPTPVVRGGRPGEG